MENKKPSLEMTQEDKVKTVAMIIAAVLLLVWWIWPSSDDPEQRVYTKYDALVNSHQFVENRLKSPGSAEWPSGSDRFVTQVNDTTFLVDSYVDSQNGFGALVRTNYTCQMVFFPSRDEVECRDLQLEQR